ncbi:hypothetical protein AOT82_1392 [Psychrobacter sp. AntiMn-1]|nr:hypothetical protein AOT82_1392 [Psychrobacter sp. AntiMn-1]HBL95451.1 hypothetical protein [Psychrobacter sp.]
MRPILWVAIADKLLIARDKLLMQSERLAQPNNGKNGFSRTVTLSQAWLLKCSYQSMGSVSTNHLFSHVC